MRTNNATGKVYRKSSGLIGVLVGMVLGISLMILCGNAIADKWTPSFFGGSDQVLDGQGTAASAKLPREWRYERQPITFDHMFRTSSK